MGLMHDYSGRVLQPVGPIIFICTCIGMSFRNFIRMRFRMRIRTCFVRI